MPTFETMSSGQKLLAACGIFLFVVGVSTAYSSTREPSGTLLVEQSAENPEVLLQSGLDAPVESPVMLDPPASTPIEDEVDTLVASGSSVSEVPPVATAPTLPPETTIIISALAANGFNTREDLAWDRRVFDSLTPYADVVAMRSYLVLGGKGEQIGRFTHMKSIASESQEMLSYVKSLVERRADPKVTLVDGTIGTRKVFLYNNLDKTENLRIVVQASAQEVYALDVPTYMQGIVDAALSAF